MKYLVWILGILHVIPCVAQEYPKGYFRNPIDIPISLAGNFGELRPNHFHAGLDLRTGKEGLKVYASAPGYVSRIKVSPTGYGKVIYITHPNGYVTVYGHLSHFIGAIEKYVKEAQYKQESTEVELFPKPEELPVQQGDLIALSGNTGNSGGPHVHFEIRDAKTEVTYNPLLFGITVTDTIAPVIKQLVLVPLDENSLVNGKNKSLKIPLHPSGSRRDGNTIYLPALVSSLKAWGKIGLEVETSDRSNLGNGINQVYALELYESGKQIYGFKMNSCSFDETRYVNAHLDYPAKKRNGETLQRCYVLKNNRCRIYENVYKDGVLNIGDSSRDHLLLKLVVYDFNGNSAEANLMVQNDNPPHSFRSPGPSESAFFAYTWQDSFCKVEIPAAALYQDFHFSHKSDKQILPGNYSVRQDVMDEYTPVHTNYTLSIRTGSVPPTLIPKLLLVKTNKKGKPEALGGEYKNGWMTCKLNEFGSFVVTADTAPPKLTSLPGKSANGKSKLIRIQVSDNLTGVKTYRATIDGKWVPLEYEPKENLLFIDTDECGVPSGNHTMVVTVEDALKNRSEITVRFQK